MTVVSSLVIEMAANVARLQQDMDRARKVVDDSMGRITGAVEGAQRAFGLLAAAAGGATFGVAIKNAINLADQMDDLAEKTGITAKALSSLRFAGEATGTPMEALSTGLRKLSQNMAGASTGGKEQAEMFARLGVSVNNASGSLRGSDAVLRDLADRFSDMQDGPAKAALAMELFGKSGVDMVPLLNQGADGIEALHNEAVKLGAVIGNDFAKQAADFNDNLTKMTAAGQGFFMVIAEQVLPILNRMASAFLDAQNGGSAFAELIGKVLKVALETVLVLGANVVFVFQGIWRELRAIYDQAGALLTLDFEKLKNVKIKLDLDNTKALQDLKNFETAVMGAGGRGAGYSDPRMEAARAQLKEAGLIEEANAARQYEAQKRLAQLREEAAKAAARQAAEAAKALEKLIADGVKLSEALTAAENGLSPDFAAKWDSLQAAFKAGALSTDQVLAAQAALLALQPAMKKAEEERLKRIKEQIDVDQRAADAMHKDLEALRKANEALELHNQEIGLTAEQLNALRIARLDEEIAIQQSIVTEYEEIKARGGVTDQLQQQINKLDELKKKRELTLGGQTAQVAVDAAKKAADEWQRTADKIEFALTDALMRGFESGKGVLRNLVDTIKNMFSTLVLRPVVQAVAGSGLGFLGLGMPGSAAASTGANFAASLLGNYAPSALASSIFGSTAAYGAAIGGGSMAAGSQAAMLAAQTSGFGAAGTLATASAAGTGSSLMASAAVAGPYVAGAVAVLNALGAFRSNETVGGGLVGTLGAGNVQAYDLNRKGGSLIDGPSYSLGNVSSNEQTAALENAFVTLRTSTAQMAKDLGLATAQIDTFTMAVGDVRVHPDIDRLGLKLDGLSEPQKLQKINELLQKSADGMAAVVLGAGATAQQLAQIYAATMQERKGLEGQLLQLQGNTVEIRKREREALQVSNRAIYDQITALQDSKAATEEAARAQLAAADMARAAAESARAAANTAASGVASASAAVQAIQQQGTSNYLTALDAVASVQSQIAAQALQVASTYRDLGKSLREYVRGIVTPPSDAFAKTLTKALAGDSKAMADLPGAATAAADAARSAAGTAAEFRFQQAQIMRGVLDAAAQAEALSATAAAEEKTLQQRLIDAQAELTEAMRVANAIGAPLAQTQANLVTQYQAASAQLADAQSWSKRMQDTLDAIKTATIAGSEASRSMWTALVMGFDKMDATQDGLLSANEFFIGMAGKATDKEIEELFALLDTNGDGQLSKLEAIVANTAIMAAKIGQGTSSAIGTATTGTTQEMTQAAFVAALQAEATKQGLSTSAVTPSFSNGLFAQLDANKSGGLSSSESSASTITSAISNLLASTTAAQAITLSAKDLQILSSGAMTPVNAGSGEAGAAVFSLFKEHLGRRPELDGYNYWVQTYAAIKAASTSANAYREIEKNIKGAAEGVGGVAGAKKYVSDYFIGLGGTQAGGEEAIKRLFFASGGAFTNGIATRPTAFDVGVMGEAGPEAIMPLSNINGSLGVRAQMPGMDGLQEELRALRAEVVNLRAEARAGALASQDHLTLTRRLTRDGQSMPVTGVQNDPLKVKVIA